MMVYHRSWWNYCVVSGLLSGLLRGELRKQGSTHLVCQSGTDGAIAAAIQAREGVGPAADRPMWTGSAFLCLMGGLRIGLSECLQAYSPIFAIPITLVFGRAKCAPVRRPGDIG